MSSAMEVLQVPSELAQMTALYLEKKPRRVLEIGCWDGGTLRVWLASGPEMVAAVDLNHRNASAYAAWTHPGTDLRLHTGSSFEQLAKDFIAENGPYDWAFIDGDHGDFGVRNDVGAVLPHMAEGALLVLHDIWAPADYEGYPVYPPMVVLQEFAEQGYVTREFVDETAASWAHGVGVIEL